MRIGSAFCLSTALLASIAFAREGTPPRIITFEERVTAQRAIEQVYWSHRIWPAGNPGEKPPLSAVMPDAAIRAKVEDYLQKSSALESFWHRPITGEQLQAELNRMTASSRDPAMLREIVAALGNDPFVLAESLARPALADRLIHRWYANDDRFHGEIKSAAEAALSACASVACMKSMSGRYAETTWTLGREKVDSCRLREPDRYSVELDPNEWTEQIDRLARKFGTSPDLLPTQMLGRLEETPEAFFVSGVVASTSSRITTATVEWPKQAFEEWWSTSRGELGTELEAPSGPYVLNETASGGCAPDTWTPTIRPFDPRELHTAVWTGTELIVWGGSNYNTPSFYLSSGARYRPATDTWVETSMGANVPSARWRHSAVWTGTEMIIWGGEDSTGPLGTGGRYSPAADSWLPTSSIGAPSARWGQTAIWAGTEMIVWGGASNYIGGVFDTGGRYAPSSDSWLATSTAVGVPAARRSHTAVWTGSKMIVWGGWGDTTFDTGGVYDPSTNSWQPTATSSLATPRSDHVAVWTGNRMVIWGGLGNLGRTATGAQYDPASDGWTATSVGSNVPEARSSASAVWTGTEMIVWGGQSETWYLQTGGRYKPAQNTWASMAIGSNAPTERLFHTATWTGSEMIVWGGWSSAGSGECDTGGRYRPSSNSWVPTSRPSDTPIARAMHKAVWTGAEMVVWGGYTYDGDYLLHNSGGRYDPATDQWTDTSTGSGVPSARWGSSVVWSGTEMIVWGGSDSNETNTGGRYNPASDSWTPTKTGPTAPTAREGHSAAWSGTQMIVWGGSDVDGPLNTGGRYAPSSNSWTQTSVGANVPSPRYSCAAVWTGTELIIWGGHDGAAGAAVNSGSRYNPAVDSWTATSVGANVPSPREDAAAVWTGDRMIIWGGHVNGTYTNTGGRYVPSTDSWTPTTTAGDVPSASRYGFSTVWTGTQMIVWGGGYQLSSQAYRLNTGGRYNPAGDEWQKTPEGTDVPLPRVSHSAVWNGTRMLVWGGEIQTYAQAADGALLCPAPCELTLYRDQDGDGYGDPAQSQSTCARAGWSTNAGDICPDVFDSTLSDLDHDGTWDMCDLDDGVITVYAADKSHLNWQQEAGFSAWNVYEGDLSLLKSTGVYTQAPGSNPLASRHCGLTQIVTDDPATIDAGAAKFWLVAGVANGVEGSLGVNSTGVERANTNPCP